MSVSQLWSYHAIQCPAHTLRRLKAVNCRHTLQMDENAQKCPRLGPVLEPKVRMHILVSHHWLAHIDLGKSWQIEAVRVFAMALRWRQSEMWRLSSNNCMAT
ncbi:hypothetical protein HETIRDRAFT_411859 [Heterobasidion irregulare TC 32-1]|uniref:Uncharacterized protein n=1 Tax=Heterobasidion irregulare (strain TC 32-1) TaxID=747525 RepID=W4JSC6_HETIT|nr:uncharacterized protein HETIRDRAFT_411859 [Heterobasidion irregulare TC 32-1]ETW76467.1 hypothetical protein HETIRDRAFT_411859 [Heterobasidion irregulare TC 32-1]